MPMSMADFETLAAGKPQGTSLAEILGVSNIYWSQNLTEWIYTFPEVIGKTAAVCPVALKDRFGS